MRLAQFIRDSREQILQEWESFAATILPAAKDMDKQALRDHAEQMLLVIAADLDQTQTERQREDKSKGRQPPNAEASAARAHGMARQASGFSINEVLSEYRALRSSVIHLWLGTREQELPADSNDLIRFNEAIDAAVMVSVQSYSADKERQTRLLESMLMSSPDLSYILDLGGRFVYANKALTDLFERPLNAILGKNFLDLKISSAAEIQEQIRQVVHWRTHRRGEVYFTLPSGYEGHYEYLFAPVIDERGEVEAIAGSGRNISDRKAWEERIWHNANYDALTGLPNRRLFRDRLDQNVKQARRIGIPFALLFIDLDRFKEANDLLGHDAGDLLLKQAAGRILACVRATDTVARLGGDEFTVILIDIDDLAQVEAIADKILAELSKPFFVAGEAVQISCSIGITLCPRDDLNAKNLVRNADQAMYLAKNAGRNRYAFFTEPVH